MSRLTSELHRLFHTDSPDRPRAMRLEVAAPADWTSLGAVWRGVQAELGLPAPVIAVSGIDGLQLWFSLAQPVAVAQANEFLAGLRARYLPGLPASRLRLQAETAMPTVPAQDAASGNWSAFVAPDLAPVFVETPWLDIEPGAEGQADLLARLSPITPAAFDAALQALRPTAEASPPPQPAAAAMAGHVEPRQFLQQVLDDEAAPLALRVEAAKALLRA
ncbi:hypothetical protein [Roseateles puraquae]|jgi:hypothetical protein|uniref:hypothetical protein n=1 Tax=Roseateles puraquae TaxID=431059 RepID=UPI0031DF2DCA